MELLWRPNGTDPPRHATGTLFHLFLRGLVAVPRSLARKFPLRSGLPALTGVRWAGLVSPRLLIHICKRCDSAPEIRATCLVLLRDRDTPPRSVRSHGLSAADLRACLGRAEASATEGPARKRWLQTAGAVLLDLMEEEEQPSNLAEAAARVLGQAQKESNVAMLREFWAAALYDALPPRRAHSPARP